MKKDLIIEVIYPDIFDLDHMLESKAFPFIREGKNLPNWFRNLHLSPNNRKLLSYKDLQLCGGRDYLTKP